VADVADLNSRVIDEFRANGGRVGPPFEGAPMTLIHHRGRKSGREYVSPTMYLRPNDDGAVMYVFATRSGSPKNPDWYYNLVDSGEAVVEVGVETFPVTVTEVTGADRDRVYAEQAARFPAFAEYEEKTAGIRTIPVLALRRR
jgi:deazaflavin-dependent oxidoreductase (nitroreductase family)